MRHIGLAIGLAAIGGIALLPFSCQKKENSNTATETAGVSDADADGVDSVDGSKLVQYR